MSMRSQRTHKPTERFLNYYTQEISPQNKNGKQKKLLKRIPSPARTATKKVSIRGRRKLPNNEVELLFEAESPSPSKTETSPEVRRSCRKHKPNQRLKEFLNVPFVSDHSENTPQVSSSPSSPNFIRKSFTGFEPNHSIKKSIAAVSPMVKRDGIKTPLRCSKHITVGLVDCFEGFVQNKGSHSTTGNDLSSLTNSNPPKFENLSTDIKLNQILNKLNKLENRRGTKRSVIEESRIVKGPLSKKEKHDSARNSKKLITMEENLNDEIVTESLSQSIRVNTDTRFPTFSPSGSGTDSSENEMQEEEEEESNVDDSVIDVTPPFSSKNQFNASKRGTQKRSANQSPPQDIRETLKKFLIMGTKVANAISETLKHNEEALLCKSSAFEKKCLSLVHALAKQGTDLEEDDMEKVLKLLDEEQEERREYRQTFLESLRVSHLTNMALYSQMLRLLKTL